MDVAIVTVSRVFKTYLGQARIAELNSKNPVKRVQGQRDHVSISKEAQDALTAHMMGRSLKPEIQNNEFQAGQTEGFEGEKIEENALQESGV